MRIRSGEVPPGTQQRVEIFGRAIGHELFGLLALSVVESSLTADALACPLVEPDDRHDRSGLLERAPRLCQLDLFKSVADQSGDALSFYSLHIGPVDSRRPLVHLAPREDDVRGPLRRHGFRHRISERRQVELGEEPFASAEECRDERQVQFVDRTGAQVG